MKNRPQLSLQLQTLETREMPANVALQANGQLLITGDAGSDYARVGYTTTSQKVNGVNKESANSNTIDVILQGENGNRITKQFAAKDVKTIAFSGRGGPDVFVNNTTVVHTTTTTSTGTVSTSVLPGSPGDKTLTDSKQVGVFTVGSTGTVTVDYLYAGAGYKGQLGFYSLEGMGNLTPNTAAYNREAARRILTNSVEGRIVINRYGATDKAKYSMSLPWEGMLNVGGTYRGQQTYTFKPGAKLGAMLVPNGRVQDVHNNPNASGSLKPLFSIPAANPYAISPQYLGQMGDLTGAGSVFAFEDLRLDQDSDRDYNDLVFQVNGARAAATHVKEVANKNRDFLASTAGKDIVTLTNEQVKADTTVVGNYAAGKYVVNAEGRLGIDYLYDGGGYVGQVGVFSLQNMGQYDPQSPEFVKEAVRRVLSNSVLGYQVIDDATDAAKVSASDTVIKSFNSGTYRGIRSFTMNPGDTVGFVLIPNGAFWEAYKDPSIDKAKRPLFSLSEANPTSTFGQSHFADAVGTGNVLGFEDSRLDNKASVVTDRDFNDIVFRVYGATTSGTTSKLNTVAAKEKNWQNTTVGNAVRVDSFENWS